MLLGCCHCGSPPSESTPPSVSESLPISEVINNCGRENCISSVFARRYKLTFNYNQTARCGPTYSAGTYILEFFTIGGDFCSFRSSGFGINWAGGLCNTGVLRLATLGFYNNGLSTPGGAASVRYILGIGAENGGSSTGIFYGSNLGNVSINANAPYNPINCLSAFTLPITSNNTARDSFHSTVTGLSGGVAAVPTSVSLEPAP
jgi:hypothetical protein